MWEPKTPNSPYCTHTHRQTAALFLIWMRLLFAAISHSWVVGRRGGALNPSIWGLLGSEVLRWASLYLEKEWGKRDILPGLSIWFEIFL